MSSLKDNTTCPLLEQYLSYLTVVKGRSNLTAQEYRIDCTLFFEYVKRIRGISEEIIVKRDFSDVDIEFIKSITVAEMYGFITYCGNERKQYFYVVRFFRLEPLFYVNKLKLFSSAQSVFHPQYCLIYRAFSISVADSHVSLRPIFPPVFLR